MMNHGNLAERRIVIGGRGGPHPLRHRRIGIKLYALARSHFSGHLKRSEKLRSPWTSGVSQNCGMHTKPAGVETHGTVRGSLDSEL